MNFNSKNNNWLIVLLFVGQLFLFSACNSNGQPEKLSKTLVIQDTLQIPVIGKNEYIRIDEEGKHLLIKRKGSGISLYNLKTSSITWELQNEELIYLGDPIQTLDIIDDNVIILGNQFLRSYSIMEGILQFTQKVPKRILNAGSNYPIFKTSIENQPFILMKYNIKENGWGDVDFISMEKEDYASLRAFTLFSFNTDETVKSVIGRHEPESNILTDEPKLPLVNELYTVVDEILYHAFSPEAKIWATPITLDDPSAETYHELELDYPKNRYFIPNNQKNNVHDLRKRMNENMSLMGIFFDPKSNRFYVPYFRALFEWEQEIVDNPKTTQSQVDLGFQRIRVAVFNQEFEKEAEVALPANIHTLIGVVNDELYLKGYDEGENYDIIYKAIIKTDE